MFLGVTDSESSARRAGITCPRLCSQSPIVSALHSVQVGGTDVFRREEKCHRRYRRGHRTDHRREPGVDQDHNTSQATAGRRTVDDGQPPSFPPTLKEKLHEAKDEAYAHSAQHQKEVSSLREELDEVTKDRDDLTRELETTREERENARREVTRMKMLSIKQQQRRLSTDTTESTMSTASSMGSGGGGRRGSMLQSFCESSRNLLGGGGSGQGAGTDAAASAANTPAQNRKSSLTVADLQISRRNLMLNQQGNAATGGPYMYGQRGSVSFFHACAFYLLVGIGC